MRIIGAFDVHRKQITYKWLDRETGEIQRGRIMPGVRKAVREFLAPFKGLDPTSPWRPRPDGALWRKSSPGWGWSRISPSPPTPPRSADRSGEPRPIAVIATT